MKKAIIWSLGIIALLAIIWIGRPDPSKNALPNGETPRSSISLVFEESSFDFGDISMRNGTVSRVFKVKNAGTAPVELRKMYTSCMCTSASLLVASKKLGPFGMPGHGPVPTFKEILKPGGEAEVNVVFDPAAHGPAGVGNIERVVYLEDGNGESAEILIRARVIP